MVCSEHTGLHGLFTLDLEVDDEGTQGPTWFVDLRCTSWCWKEQIEFCRDKAIAMVQCIGS